MKKYSGTILKIIKDFIFFKVIYFKAETKIVYNKVDNNINAHMLVVITVFLFLPCHQHENGPLVL